MKPISLHVEEEEYRSLKSLAERTGRPVAELIREAMAEYLARCSGRGKSILGLAPHDSGALLQLWTREDLLDEMLER
jgi:predicted transcriptional regulator